jgi:hypothetical protein
MDRWVSFHLSIRNDALTLLRTIVGQLFWLVASCGKSTIIAVYILWFAIFHDDKKCLVASNKNANAIEIMSRIEYAYEELPLWLKPGCKYFNKHSVEFDNGSKIESQGTTEKTGRGGSYSLVMLDELAFVPRRIQDAMWVSLAPTISTGGSIIVSSTPNGDQDLFATLWRKAEMGSVSANEENFVPVRVEWNEHPDRDESFKGTMISKVGELMWRQEYCCEFVSSDALLINSLKITTLQAKPHLFEDKGFKFWIEHPDLDSTYFIGSDISTGVGNDYSTIQVVEFPSMQQVAEFRSNTVTPSNLYNRLKWIANWFSQEDGYGRRPQVYWSFEYNSVGAAISTLYNNDENFSDHAELVSTENRTGLLTSAKTKIQSCLQLKRVIEKTTNRLELNSSMTIAEIKSYISNGASYAAKDGATDDLISALLIIMQMMRKVAEYDYDMFQAVHYDDPDPEFSDDADTDSFDEPMAIVM